MPGTSSTLQNLGLCDRSSTKHRYLSTAVELQVNGEQARKEMQLMEQHALSLKARIVEAQNAGDTKKVKH